MNLPCVHLICNAHLDPVWQWRWEEGCAEAISTFRQAVRILDRHPSLIFNHNEALLYQWIHRYDRNLYEEIRHLVKAGRWAISGGWYLQPDCNLPGTESLIRHIQEGRRYFRERFQAEPLVAYNVDAFGHSGGLPQILSRSGFKMYIHMRPQKQDLDLPADLYRWRGVDGTIIAAQRIPVGLYHTEFDNIEQRLEEAVALALELGHDVPLFWGIGDHGGGATLADLEKIDRFRKKERRVSFAHSTPDRYYAAVKDRISSAPVVDGDLQGVFTGCYTSLARVKRRAGTGLSLLNQTEALAAAAWWQWGHPYPQSVLEGAWRLHLFNDFHDILPGTCIEPAERDALDRYGRVSDSLRELRMEAACVFSRAASGSGGIPLAVLNTNPGLKRMPVEAECMISHRPPDPGDWHLRLYRADGREIICQEEQPEALQPFNGWRRKITFMTELPDVGFAAFRMEVRKGRRKTRPRPPALDIALSPQSGLITRLCSRQGEPLAAGPIMQPIVISDHADSWGTDCTAYCRLSGKFKPVPESQAVIETGPIRTIHETVWTFRRSRITMHTILYASWPAVEYRLRVSWAEDHERLKLALPTVFDTGILTCEVPGGIIRRPADGREHVHRRWLLISDETGRRTSALGLAHNGLHGFDCRKGEIRLSVLRSAAYCHEQGFEVGESPRRKLMDQGIHDIRILMTAGKTRKVLKDLPALADWLSSPPFSLSHLPPGSFPEKIQVRAKRLRAARAYHEIISLKPSHLRLLSCHPQRRRNGLIVRIQECAGLRSQGELIDRVSGHIHSFTIKPLEIRTFAIRKEGACREIPMLER